MVLGGSFKYNKRILFLVDHKHRDMPSLSLIGYFLGKMGYEVKYVALRHEDPIIRSFKPQYLILPKPIYDLTRLIRFKIRGHKLIVINTEGNPGGNKTLKMNIQVPPDLFFFWNQFELQVNSTMLSDENTTFRLTGCPRTDFLEDDFLKLYPSRVELLKKYNLPPHRKTITIATSTANADLRGDALKRKIEQLKNQAIQRVNYEEVHKNIQIVRDLTKLMIRHIVCKHPEVNLVIKPHPNEDIVYWQDLVNLLPNNNVHLSLGEPIDHLLRVSDLNIAHNACTTTFESLLSGVPAVEIHTDKSINLFKADRLNLPTYVIKTVDELDHVIKKELYRGDGDKKENGEQSEELKDYISNYFYKCDGLRCYEHARAITDFVEDSVEEVPYYGKFIVNNPKFVVKYLKSRVKRYVFRPIKTYVGKVSERQEALDAKGASCSNDKMVGDKVLYDARIKPGDEEYWYRKFEAAGFSLEDFEDKYLEQKEMKAQYREDSNDV